MKDKVWKPQYETGIEFIDSQHKIFLQLINRLIHFEDGQLPNVPLERLLQEIEAYANFHFISEENYMMEIGYPGLEQQQQEHQLLRDSLRKRIEAVHEDEENVIDLHMRLLTWLLNHTTESDKDIGRYQRQQEASA